MKKDYTLLDDAFRQRLQGAEQPFEELAWADMLNKLEASEKRRKGWLFSRSGLLLAGMFVLIAGLATVYFFNQSGSVNSETKPQFSNTPKTDKESSSIELVPPTLANPGITLPPNSPENRNSITSLRKYVKPTHKENSTKTATAGSDELPDEFIMYERPESITLNGFLLQAVGLKRLEQVEYVSQSKKSNLRNKVVPFMLGLHYQSLLPVSEFKRAGYLHMKGFELDVFSKNLYVSKAFQLKAGANVGLGFTTSSQKFELLNQVAAPIGNNVFMVNTTTWNLNLVSRMEFGNNRLRPYADVFAGLRTLKSITQSNPGAFQNATNQTFLLTNPEPAKSFAFQYGIATGVYYPLNARFAFDGKVSLMSGTPISNIPNAGALLNNWSSNAATKSLVSPQVKPQFVGVNFGIYYFLSGK